MKYELRPMDVGEILDRSARIYLQNFSKLLAISLLVAVPMVIFVGVAVPVLGLTEYDDSDPGRVMELFVPLMILAGVLSLASLVANALAQGALIKAISDLYLDRPSGMGDALSRAFGRLLPLVIAAFVQGFLIAVSMFACCIPFFFVYPALSVVIPAVILEGRGPIEAVSRSWDLTKDNRMRLLGALLVVLVLVLVLSQGVNYVLALVGLNFLIQTVAGQFSQALILPFTSVVTILLYYDLRVRKEAFDLQVLAREVGGGEGGAV